MVMKYKLNFVLLLAVSSVCALSSSDGTKYSCHRDNKTVETVRKKKCTVKNVMLQTKVHFNERFSLEYDTPTEFEYSEMYEGYSTPEDHYELNFINSTITYIPKSLFVVKPYLRNLNMAKCNLIEISPYDFLNAVRLRVLDLSHNELTEIKYLAFNGASTLLELNLAFNKISNIEMDAFENVDTLRELDLSNNRLTTITKSTFGTLNFTQLHLKANKISVLNDDTFKSLNVGFLNLDYNQIAKILINYENIGVISLNNNELVEVKMTANNKLNWLLADNNRIRHFEAIGDQAELKVLSLSNNSLNNFNFIKMFTGLLQLDLSLNPLSSDRFESDLFSNLIYLNYLSLAGINLGHLDFEIFANLQDLSTLDVSENNLQTIEIPSALNTILRRLTLLYINGNNLNRLSEAQLQNLFEAVSNIDITDNDLECHNRVELLKKIRKFKPDASRRHNDYRIFSVTCYNRISSSDTDDENGNINYLKMDQIRFELNAMKKHNENLKLQIADALESYNKNVNGIEQHLKELNEKLIVLNATYRNDIEQINTRISRPKINLGDLLEGDATNEYSLNKTVSSDDGKIVNILIV